MSTSKTTGIPSQSGGSVTDLDQHRRTTSIPQPIAGMRPGWSYRPSDRVILYFPGKDKRPLEIGTVPRVIAQISHLTDDGQDIRIEYLVVGPRQRRPRILTEDELDRGTWASKAGVPRPTGSDERHAYARLIRELGNEAPQVYARTHYNDQGDLVLPDADAQQLGYRTMRGTEAQARAAWTEIAEWAAADGKAAMVLGAMFVGPVLDSIGVLAHMLNLRGVGQQGKSTMVKVSSALFGDVKPKRQQIWVPWNSSKQGITQTLRLRGFLPMCLDEHSSSGRKIRESSAEISQMVAGAIRMMGTADGSPRDMDGFWLSIILSTSNQPLKFEGQTEDLATRLQEVDAPFWPNLMVEKNGAPAQTGGAEHLSERITRLALDHGGWPIEWACKLGMFKAANLIQLKQLHLDLCAKYRPDGGGIPATIAKIHTAWVVGAHMLGLALDVPDLGPAAEATAADRLKHAIQVSEEVNIGDGERLWGALDALRIEAAVFPSMEQLPTIAKEGRAPKGFTEAGRWWVIDPVVRQAAEMIGIDNSMAALRELSDLKVHLRPTSGRNTQRKIPRELQRLGLGDRMHCFDTVRAAELFAPADEDFADEEGGTTSGTTSETPHVVPEKGPLTCTGTTGTTGTTSFQLVLNTREENEDQDQAAEAPTDVVVIPPRPAFPPPVPAPAGPAVTGVAYPAPVPLVTDAAWAHLEERAAGRTRGATRFGVLGYDGRGAVLYLPNRQPLPVPLPESVDRVPALMRAYNLRTLWLHAELLPVLDMPTYAQRRAARVGPASPSPCVWATPGEAIESMTPEPGSVSCWMTLSVAGKDDTTDTTDTLNLAIPAYENRMDKSHQGGRGGWGGAADPATLLDALMIYLVSTQHGPADRPKVLPYYRSVNKTAEEYAGGKHRDDVTCEAIRSEQVTHYFERQTMVPMVWHRPLTDAELDSGFLHRFDRVASWMAAYSSVFLGIGEPVHAEHGHPWSAEIAGTWRVASLPGDGTPGLPGLPELRVHQDERGGYWLYTPEVSLLRTLHPEWEPEVIEALYWPRSKRALEPMYKHLLSTRRGILAAADAGRPGAKWAKQCHGRLFSSFRGYLERNKPQRDFVTGELYVKDIYWRPDWAQLLLAHAQVCTYMALMKTAADGRPPISLYVDAITLTSDSDDPTIAKTDRMEIGNTGGKWQHEVHCDLGPLREQLRDPGTNPHTAMNDHLRALGER